MISKEQLAHDLTMVYLSNRFGIDVIGSVSDGSGSISTWHFPSADTPKYIKVGTGEKGLLFEKKKKVQAGYEIDDFFSKIVETYYMAYSRFLQIICESQNE